MRRAAIESLGLIGYWPIGCETDRLSQYDNEHGKGDHRHTGAVESPYHFTSPEQLIADFWRDIDEWRR